MKKILISFIILGVILSGCGQEVETIHEGIIEDLEFQKDKIYTAALKNDYYTMTVNGQKHEIMKSDWETLEVGMRVRYVEMGMGSRIMKIKDATD